jgi:hypothetical protein
MIRFKEYNGLDEDAKKDLKSGQEKKKQKGLKTDTKKQPQQKGKNPTAKGTAKKSSKGKKKLKLVPQLSMTG